LVNSTTVKTAPKGTIDQLGHSLTCIIHAFAEAEEDALIFMAKWDIKDGFWRLYPPFFCAALETARDVPQDYCETKLGTLPLHKFTNYLIGNQDYENLPERDELIKFF